MPIFKLAQHPVLYSALHQPTDQLLDSNTLPFKDGQSLGYQQLEF
jgi:hypothetical protein